MSLLTQVFALLVVATVAVGGTAVYFKSHNNGNAESQTAAVAATANEPVFFPPENNAEENSAPEVKNTPAVSTEVKTTAKTEVKPQTPKASSAIKGKITAYITDQYGKPYTSGINSLIQDALGEASGGARITDGRLESTTTLPPGQYTIWIAYDNISGIATNLTPVEKKFTLPSEGINLGTIVVNKWTYAKLKVVNEVGTDLSKAMAGTRCFMVKSDITDEFLKKYPRSKPPSIACGGGGNQFWDKIGPFPPGTYTLKIAASTDYESVEKTFTVGHQDVDLGTITLKKQ